MGINVNNKHSVWWSLYIIYITPATRYVEFAGQMMAKTMVIFWLQAFRTSLSDLYFCASPKFETPSRLGYGGFHK